MSSLHFITRKELVLRALESDCFEEVFALTQLRNKKFYADPQHKDLLIFSQHGGHELVEHELVKSGQLVLQVCESSILYIEV